MTLTKHKKYRLGDELVAKGAVSSIAVQSALAQQKKTGERLGRILLQNASLSESRLIEFLADQWGVPFVNPAAYQPAREVLDRVPAKFIQHYQIFPLEIKDGEIHLAVSSSVDFDAVAELGTLLGAGIRVSFAEHKKIAEAIEKNYGLGASVIEKLVADKKTSPVAGLSVSAESKIEDVEAAHGEGSVRELVSMLLTDAKKKRASDIHLEPFGDEMIVRYRIDGVLQEASVPEAIRQFHSGMITRIKIMANLDISERRLPQDGRVKISVQGDELDIRISILPTGFGESLVIRILSSTELLDLDRIGLSPKNIAIVRDLLSRPHGMILLTGPTGSGKTTTLYSALNAINKPEYKIITVEDPVEYQLKGIIQMQVHPKIGLSFASGLRHMLRHDPDIMMIGEIRDSETAEIAIRSALTGHLVFSTLHTNDAPGAVTRLMDLGMAPYLVASSLNAVIAQRLVRLLCTQCKNSSGGCEACRGTGYQGRTAIHEIMVIDEEIREMLIQKVPAGVLRKVLTEKGMKGLLEDGMSKVRLGLTSEGEVLRVVR